MKILLCLRKRLRQPYHGRMRHAISSARFISVGLLAGGCTSGSAAGRRQIRGTDSAAGKFGRGRRQVGPAPRDGKPGSPERKMGPVSLEVRRGIARTAPGWRCVRRERRSLVKSIVHPIGREIPRKSKSVNSLDFHRSRGPIPKIILRQTNPAGTCVLTVSSRKRRVTRFLPSSVGETCVARSPG